MAAPLTLMAVHAHPDDECIGTGGILARYSASGIRTVVVTCTDGEEGDGPGGVKPGQSGHDPETVAAVRRAELERSCALLGVHQLEMLGYRDSGMVGWEGNANAGAFANVAVDQVAARIAELIERYQPQVLVTYDADGGYGHPDHIQAHRVTVAAADISGIPDKLYYSAIPRSLLAGFATRLREAGVDLDAIDFPQSAEGEDPPFGVPDELIDAVIDVSAFTDVKLQALRAHASQTDNSFFTRLPAAAFNIAFSSECFIRARSRVELEGAEDDLFRGLR